MKRKNSKRKPNGVVRMVDPRTIKVPTRLLHESLNQVQSALSRYTWIQCGKYLYASYEQWENGFLREMNPDSELQFWAIVAKGCEERNFADESERKELIRNCVMNGVEQVMPWVPAFLKSNKLELWLEEIFQRHSESGYSDEDLGPES